MAYPSRIRHVKGGPNESVSQPPHPESLSVVSISRSANRVEHVFEMLVFGSRWIQAPLYGGLIMAELLYAYKFIVELWEMIHGLRESSETLFMLGILSLIDITMVANLLTMVVIGGYATFVSKLDLEGHPDRPEWLHEIKHDGYRLIVQREDKRVRLFTRNGHDWSGRYPLITEAALRNRNSSFVVDGEAVLLGRRRPVGLQRAAFP